MDSDEEHDGDAGTATLTGFLFGNIDEKGQLVDDVLDEESKRHISGLSSLGIQPMVKELTENADDSQNVSSEDEQSYGEKAANAVDYSDITEVAEEEQVQKYKQAMQGLVAPKIEDTDDYDDLDGESTTDKKLMPPPSWLPSQSQSSPILTPRDSPSTSTSGSPNTSLSPSKRFNTPLAGMLPPELADKDVKDLFPEFNPGSVLRFSRLFKPVYTPHIWKKKKKKKEDEEKPPDMKKEVKEEPGSSGEPGKEITEEEKAVASIPAVSSKRHKRVYYEVHDDALDMEQVEREGYPWPFELDMGRPALPEEMAEDDEVKLMRPVEETREEDKDGESSQEYKPEVAEWRYGPAQYWYDILGVDSSGEGFNYGYKPKEEPDEKTEEEPETKQVESQTEPSEPPEIPEEAFHMVTQLRWEDDIIWNADDVRQKIIESSKKKGAIAGWIPSSATRTCAQYQQLMGKMSNTLKPGIPGRNPMLNDEDDLSSKTWYSIFPVENEELIYERWEDKVIWDASDMETIPKPQVLTLDPNDENIILGIPDDVDPSEENSNEPVKKEKQEIRKSKILLSKTGFIKEEEDIEDDNEVIETKDPFNISNDEYYNPKLTTDSALRTNMGGAVIQHSIPALELRQPYFPTFLSLTKLRSFHRIPLKKYSHGMMASHGPHPVLPLLKQIRRKAKLREQERLASGGGEMFFMRTPQDLTGMDGDLILSEYSEEYPPLIMQVGMATKIKNYYKRKPGTDNRPMEFRYGDLAYAHTSPFLGSLKPGQCIQAFENTMFRAPIYEHKMADNDFLIIRTRQHYYVRIVDTIFTVGQCCPLTEVPGPNSKKANNFIRDFLQVFIYRLFGKSKDVPKRIKMDDIKKAFPSHSESSIRKRLKLCADFKRTGMDSNWWVLKYDFRLPTEDEMRAMVSPEECCGYYSMLAAEQRLKDAGYGEKSLFAPEEECEDDVQSKIEDEVRTAPWNTTRAYISAMKGKCLLSLTGVADPTGVGEGFSYVKVPNKPTQTKEKEEAAATPAKKTVTGTDADLRRLSLKDAKSLLKKFGLPEHEIKKLSRWEVIDVVRTMSTEQAKAGQEGGTTSKFARGNRFSIAEHMERYKEECQRIFDLQNRVLGSSEVLSTDEESSSGGDDSDFEEMGKNIENMLANKKTSREISHEKEEQERRELQKMLMGDDTMDKGKGRGPGSGTEDSNLASINGKKLLKITRVFKNEAGREFTRTEYVRKQPVIDTYVRIRQSKGSSFIKQFATLDDAQKEEMKKERRRIQEQLRRIKRNQERDKERNMQQQNPIMSSHSSSKKKKKKKKDTPPLKMKCGACGAIGHMRTNKDCPLYNKLGGPDPEPEVPKIVVAGAPKNAPVQVAMTEEQEEEEERKNLVDEELTKVEDTRLIISKALLEHHDKVKRKSLVLKFPKPMVESNKKKRRPGTIIHCDYLKKPSKMANRRRIDPVVTMTTILESILNEMRDLPDTQPFLFPVNAKIVPDYYKIVRKPMDLQSIRENLRNRKYHAREAFIIDVNQIVENSKIYNGGKSVLTITAQRMLDHCLQRIAEKEDKLMRLEKTINPLLDDNDQVAFSFILEEIINTRLKTVDNSRPFHQPVNRKLVKDYYEIIESPMDLSSLLTNVTKHKYHHRDEFLEDVALIYKNSTQYNGAEGPLTETSKRILLVAQDAINESDAHLIELEANMKLAQEAALEAAETDSIMTGTSLTGFQEEGSITGADLESVGSGMRERDNLTIVEDNSVESLRTGKRKRDGSSHAGNVSEEFVDVEGFEESFERRKRRRKANGGGLAKDLRMTPDHNSEDGMLTDAGSDSEPDTEGQESSQQLMAYGLDDSALQNAYMMAGQEGMVVDQDQVLLDQQGNVMDQEQLQQLMQQQQLLAQQQSEEGDNFDPSAFFASLPQGNEELSYSQGDLSYTQGDMSQDVSQSQQSNLNADLEISESEESEASANEQNDSGGGFDFDDYL